MHWTSYLEYRRRHNPRAVIIGEVGCVQCGYNLRGLRVGGRCPECGNAIADALYVLVNPTLVAQSLRSFANSYATLLMLAGGCVGSMYGAKWMEIVLAIVIFCGAAYRVWWASELHFRADFTNSEALSVGARRLWCATLVELLFAAAWVAMTFIVAYTPSLQTQTGSLLIMYAEGVWMLCALLTAGVAGALGSALAARLGYGWTVIEFRVQRWAIAIAAAAVLFGSYSISPLATRLHPAAVATFVVLAAIAVVIATGITWIALHHVANASESATETLDEALDTE